MITLNIVGAGRLGQSLARLAADSGRYRIAGVLCRGRAHADAAVAFIGAGTPCTDVNTLPCAELTLIAVPDARIAEVAAALAGHAFSPGALAFHASGAGEVGLLAPLAARGVAVGCLHPAYSFADPARAAAGFAGTPCAIDGDDAVVARLTTLAEAVGGAPFRLAPGGKAAYHAALSVASNYLVTLTALAGRLARDAGVPDAAVAGLIGPLMRQTLDNALTLGPAAALTGPIVRGDAGTVARHLAVFSAGDDAAAYRALGRLTLALAQESGRPDAAGHAALRVLLGEPFSPL